VTPSALRKLCKLARVRWLPTNEIGCVKALTDDGVFVLWASGRVDKLCEEDAPLAGRGGRATGPEDRVYAWIQRALRRSEPGAKQEKPEREMSLKQQAEVLARIAAASARKRREAELGRCDDRHWTARRNSPSRTLYNDARRREYARQKALVRLVVKVYRKRAG
jgi:hypothetical protein